MKKAVVNLSTTAVMTAVTITGNNFIYFILLLLLFTLFIIIAQVQVVVSILSEELETFI